ncbi:hypothetical protein QBC40DRAFT_185766 [Triangularia verruculosa]|uniref:SET domain-containing protein n=1 Tax=Triangularia verruculosa TaxID=2587418 RepID=A0AAN6XB92_9PEZI|nr:hypothetical protein QBC40DRAFT_185766 [Triangularia verruculosa]
MLPIHASAPLLIWQSAIGPPWQTCPPMEIAQHTSTSVAFQLHPLLPNHHLISGIWSSWRKGSCYQPGKNNYCVYMQPSFNDGRGISLVTTSSVIDHGAFSDLNQKVLSELVEEAVFMLLTASRETFFGLSGREGLSKNRALAIFGNNAFRTKMDRQTEFHTLFLDVSSVNHACSPNAAYHFDPRTFRKSLFAVRDIYPGDEVTIGYVDLTQTSQQRQSSLSLWNFTCSCPRCTQPSHLQKESDSRTAQLLDIRNQLDQYELRLQDEAEKAELLISLHELEGLEVRIHEAYYRAAIEFNGVKNKWKAIRYATMCLERGLLLKDETRPFVVHMRNLVDDAAGHWSWGFRLGGEE